MDRRTLLRTGLSASAAAALASTAGCAPWTSGSKRAGEFRVEPTEDGIRSALEAAAKTQGEDFRYAYAQVPSPSATWSPAPAPRPAGAPR